MGTRTVQRRVRGIAPLVQSAWQIQSSFSPDENLIVRPEIPIPRLARIMRADNDNVKKSL